MAKYLLDTTTIIDHLRGNGKVTSYLESLGIRGDEVGCCCINVAETYAGMRESERELTGRFVQSLDYYEVTLKTAQLAGEIKRRCSQEGKTLALADVIIAATAIANDAVLVTRNVKHYPIPELKLYQTQKGG